MTAEAEGKRNIGDGQDHYKAAAEAKEKSEAKGTER